MTKSTFDRRASLNASAGSAITLAAMATTAALAQTTPSGAATPYAMKKLPFDPQKI